MGQEGQYWKDLHFHGVGVGHGMYLPHDEEGERRLWDAKEEQLLQVGLFGRL